VIIDPDEKKNFGYTIFTAKFNRIVEANIQILTYFFVIDELKPMKILKTQNPKFTQKEITQDFSLKCDEIDIEYFNSAVMPLCSYNCENPYLIDKFEFFSDFSYVGAEVEFEDQCGENVKWKEVYIPSLLSLNLGKLTNLRLVYYDHELDEVQCKEFTEDQPLFKR
jgi:hypothetical protein